MGDSKAYNGWSNFETWRVYSDFLHDAAETFASFPEEYESVSAYADALKAYVQNQLDSFKTLVLISGTQSENLLVEYLQFFIDRVDYMGIAESTWDEYQEGLAL